MDYERFESLCRNSDPVPERRLEALLEAISLYQGEFLVRQSSDSWVVPISAHFQNLFLNCSMEAAKLLHGQQRYEEAARICRRCLAAEPYYEPACQLLMEVLAAAGDVRGAAEAYENLSRRLFEDFAIQPGDDTRAIYRSVVHAPEEHSISMDQVLKHLQEPEVVPGALECDYDYFKMLCFAERRSLERSGDVAHVALLSVTGFPGKALSKRSLTRVMDQFGQTLRMNLRRGDVISRCTTSQYIVLLPRANYENSCMVCRRCIAAFQRKHPHVSAKLNYLVQPLTSDYHLP